jgi:hypothetical protein
MTYTKCQILNHEVEFKSIPTSGCISVGVDGWLVGNYENDSAAIVAALEQIRVMDGLVKRPLISNRIRKNLREMVAANAS